MAVNGMDRSNRTGMIVFGMLLAFGLIICGWVLGSEIKAIKLSDRYVAVKGLVERKVKSDLAIWPIDYKEAGDNLASLYAKTESDKTTILQFLSQQGIQSSEVEIGVVRVVDRQTNEYGNAEKAAHRYIVQQQITVRTARVDLVAEAAQKAMLLVQRGIVLGSDRGETLTYKFTGLNSIKPDMISEATRNARAAANRFAADSGSKVGSIRSANQGVFSILAADQASSDTEESAYTGESADSSLMKTVRVVTSVEYYLEK